MNQDTLKKIGEYILTGMSEKEACLLSDFSYNELQNLKEKSEKLRDFIEKKHIEFKYNHLKEIQSSKSEKNSQWILEKLRPDEFGSRARSSEAPTVNIINAIIKDIQNENSTIASFTRGNKKLPGGGKANEDDRDKPLEVSAVLV